MNALKNSFLPNYRRRCDVVARIGAPATRGGAMVSTRRDFTRHSIRCRSNALSSTVLKSASGHRGRLRLRQEGQRYVPGRRWRGTATLTATEKSISCEESSSAFNNSGYYYGSTAGIAVALATSTGIAAFLASTRTGVDKSSNKNNNDNDTRTLEYSSEFKERSNNNDNNNDNNHNNTATRGISSSSFPLYSYLLEQVKVVRYSEERDSSTISSSSGRNKPTGLAGLACIHCCGKGVAVGGKFINTDTNTDTNINDTYTNKMTTTQQQQLHPDATIFPQDRRTLAKEVKTKLYHHVLNCEQSPPKIKETLRRLFWEQHQQQLVESSLSRLGEADEQNDNNFSNSEKQITRPATAKSLKKTTRPIISKEERLYFKTLWYRMGHKDMWK